MGAWIGLSLAKQSELVIGRAHELLQASNVISMLMVLGSKSVAEFLGKARTSGFCIKIGNSIYLISSS